MTNDKKPEPIDDFKKPKKGVTGKIKSAIDERKKLDAKITELTEALQRERADVINIRRRHEAQMTGLRNVAKASVIRDLLPAIDNLERGLKHVPKDIGVERIKTKGEAFNPDEHEAISMEDGEGSREVVSEELQSGYKLGDEVIRHAMVKVKTEK